MIFLLTHPTRRRGQSLWSDTGAWWTTAGWRLSNDHAWSRTTIRGPMAMPMSEVRAAITAAGAPMELWRVGEDRSGEERAPILLWRESTDPKPGLFAFAGGG